MLSASFLFALLWEDGAKQLLDIGRGQRLSAVACHPVLGGKLIGVIRKLHQMQVAVAGAIHGDGEGKLRGRDGNFPAGSVLLDGNLSHRADCKTCGWVPMMMSAPQSASCCASSR